MKIVRSPIVYMGSKGRYAETIIKNLPNKPITKALDIFGGSGDVGVLMLPYKDVTVNDLTSQLIEIHEMFVAYKSTPEALIKVIEDILKSYDLQVFDKSKVDYLKSQYFKMRDDYNAYPTPEKLYALHCTSNSNMLRFSSNGMNVPYGERKFNKELKAKLVNWMSVLCKRDEEITFTSEDFRKLDFNKYDFVYSDSPYLNTTSGYQSTKRTGWGVREEYALYNKLDNYKGLFMLSNQVYSKGKENSILREWVESRNDLTVRYLDSGSYTNCNYQRDNGKTVELLITNY